MKLTVRENWIDGDSFGFRGEHPVIEAVQINERIVVTYDWSAFDPGKAARNLFCYDKMGGLIWRVGDIGMGNVDAYTGVISETPLQVGNFAGFTCCIDEATGRVIDTIFTK